MHNLIGYDKLNATGYMYIILLYNDNYAIIGSKRIQYPKQKLLYIVVFR